MFGCGTLSRSETGGCERAGARPAFMPYFAIFLMGLAISAALFVVALRHSQHDDLQQMYQEEAVPLTVVLGRSIENTQKGIIGAATQMFGKVM